MAAHRPAAGPPTWLPPHIMIPDKGNDKFEHRLHKGILAYMGHYQSDGKPKDQQNAGWLVALQGYDQARDALQKESQEAIDEGEACEDGWRAIIGEKATKELEPADPNGVKTTLARLPPRAILDCSQNPLDAQGEDLQLGYVLATTANAIARNTEKFRSNIVTIEGFRNSLKTKGLGILRREFFTPAVMPLYVSSLFTRTTGDTFEQIMVKCMDRVDRPSHAEKVVKIQLKVAGANDALVRVGGLKSITIFDLVDFAHQNQVNLIELAQTKTILISVGRTTSSLPMMRQAANDMENGVINMIQFADILREHEETVEASNALKESILGEQEKKDKRLEELIAENERLKSGKRNPHQFQQAAAGQKGPGHGSKGRDTYKRLGDQAWTPKTWYSIPLSSFARLVTVFYRRNKPYCVACCRGVSLVPKVGQPPHNGNHCLKGYYERAPLNDQWAPAELFECQERKDALGPPPYHHGPTLIYNKVADANSAETFQRAVAVPTAPDGAGISETDLANSHDKGFAMGKDKGYNEGYLAFQMQAQAQAQAAQGYQGYSAQGYHAEGSQLEEGSFAMGGGSGGSFFSPVGAYYGHQ